MADQTVTSLRVRISADLADIRQGMGLLRGDLAKLRTEATKPLPNSNPIAAIDKSAKDASQTLRMLAPQLTDVVVSLQSGMPFYTVFLQQGGQIRDVASQMGIGIKDIGIALLGLVTPGTVAAAVLGTLAVAWYQGVEEQSAFSKALATTGGVAGVTTDQLVAMSEALAGGDITQGKAAEALAAVAANGKIAGTNFQMVAAAAAAMEDATGRSIETTVGAFAKLAQDPVGAITELTKGQGALTASVYEQIKALVDQGDKTAAVQLATETYYAATIKQAADVKSSLGPLQRAWDGVTTAAKRAWDAMLDIGRKDSGQARFQELEGEVAKLQATLDTMGTNDRRSGLLQNQIAAKRAEMKQLSDAFIAETKAANQKMLAAQANEGVIEQEQELAQYRTQEQKRVAEIAKATGDARNNIFAAEASGNKELATKIASNRDALIAAINKKYAKKGDGGLASTRSAGLQGFADAGEVEKAQIDAQTKVLQAQYQARTISAQEYYAKLKALTEQGTDVQAAALEKQIAYLQAQAVKGKDAINVNKQIAELESKLAVVRTEGAAKVQTLDQQEAALAKQRADAITSYKDALSQQEDALQLDLDSMVDRVGAGDREYEIQQKLNSVYQAGAKELTKLARARAQANGDTDALASIAEQEQAAKDSTERSAARVTDAYARLSEAQGDWSKGAAAGWNNFSVEAQDVAGQVQGALSDAFSGAEDVFVEFVKTGKLSFSSLVTSVLADLARIGAKKTLFGALSALTGGGGTTGTLASLFSGSFLQWDTGGYTGPGGKYQVAGAVHKGEGVLSQTDIAAMGGPQAFLSFLGALRGKRGYAEGGLVASSLQSVFSPGATLVNLTVNKGASKDSAQVSRGNDGSLNIQLALKTAVQTMIGTGELDSAFAQRFNLPVAGVRRG